MKPFLRLAVLAAAVAPALFAQAPPDPATLLQATASVTPGGAAGRGSLGIRAKLAAGWHVNSHIPSDEYLIPTAVKLESAPGVRFGEPRYPEGKLLKFAFSEKPLSVYAEEFAVDVPVEWSAADTPAALSGSVEFQACNDSQCLAPASVTFRAAFAAASSGAATASPSMTGGRYPSRRRAVCRDRPPPRGLPRTSATCSGAGAWPPCSCCSSAGAWR